MVDPRIAVIDHRLRGAHHIIAVSGAKGGVGKSLVASVMALLLAKKGHKVGLLDLDFTSPSSHIVLGAGDLHPVEDKGLVPPKVHGIEYMSIVFYSGQRPAPLRGADVSNALIELLAVTRWGKLDYLVIDMPPGLSDATLDVIRFVRQARFLVVTTPSPLAFETVGKLLDLLLELRVPVIGVVENMVVKASGLVSDEARRRHLSYWGRVSFDSEIDHKLGDPAAILATRFGEELEKVMSGRLGIP